MKNPILLWAFALTLLAPAAQADETPETILIRQSLDNDKLGRRRGDVELILSAFTDQVVVYDAHHSPDPRAWSVVCEDLPEFTATVKADLEAHRYDIERSVPFIHVRAGKAMVTTIDSGQVVDRRTGASQYARIQGFWTFIKQEDKWLVTAFVHDLGDTITTIPGTGTIDPDVSTLLQQEEEGWEKGSAGAIAGLFDPEFIGYDGYNQLLPAQWKIIFSNAAELEIWLKKRLEHTRYTIDRQVVYTRLSNKGRQALALTREKVSTAYKSGSATHSLERYVLWTLSRQGGSWKITNMLYDLGLPD